VVWLGWCGIRTQAEVVLQPNHNVTPTRIKPEQYNPLNNSTNKSQAPEDGCFSLHTDTTPPQPDHNISPTHIKPEQYNP